AEQEENERRENASDPSLIEGQQREAAFRLLFEDDRSDQIAGDDEEDVDPDEAAGDEVELGVECDDSEDGDGPQSVYVRSVPARHGFPKKPCPCCRLLSVRVQLTVKRRAPALVG